MKAEYVQHMGTDLTVVNAARVSFNKESNWEYDLEAPDSNSRVLDAVEKLSAKDTKLIKYLDDHGHFTPFTHCTITLRETIPIFLARQRFKHTVGFSYNEVSRRYVDDPPEFYTPTEWRMAPTNGAKQGSSTEVLSEDEDAQYSISERYDCILRDADDLYSDMLDAGIAPEMARMILPQSMYTSYYVTGSLSAWARAYNQRTDLHAQREWDTITTQWNEIFSGLYPVSWKELTNAKT